MMTAARMTAAELDVFLRTELPQMFDYDDLTIEHADGRTCRIRQRFRESMLRPGRTVSGATLMVLADCAMYVLLLSAIGPVGLAVTPISTSISYAKAWPVRTCWRLRSC